MAHLGPSLRGEAARNEDGRRPSASSLRRESSMVLYVDPSDDTRTTSSTSSSGPTPPVEVGRLLEHRRRRRQARTSMPSGRARPQGLSEHQIEGLRRAVRGPVGTRLVRGRARAEDHAAPACATIDRVERWQCSTGTTRHVAIDHARLLRKTYNKVDRRATSRSRCSTTSGGPGRGRRPRPSSRGSPSRPGPRGRRRWARHGWHAWRTARATSPPACRGAWRRGGGPSSPRRGGARRPRRSPPKRP